MAENSTSRQVNMPLFIVTILLVVIGVLLVFDASYARALREIGNSGYYGNKQLVFAIVGVILMLLIMSYFKYWYLIPIRHIILIASIIGLALVLVPGIGIEEYGARRWIRICGQKFQPSEFAKLGLIVYVAYTLTRMHKDVVKLNKLIPPMIPVVAIIMLVLIEDMGTAIVMALTVFTMLYMGGARNRHLAFGSILAVLVGAVFIFMEPYRMKRVLIFLNPFKDPQGDGYQLCQSLIALGSGGLFGMGICEGRQKLMFLPAEHTDFIFSVLGQEVGFLGALVLIALFIAFGVIGLKIASSTKDIFGNLLAGGITVMICGQALLNIAVVTSSVPTTGVPLPFISYGGTSLLMNLICVGILLSISRYPGVLDEYKNRANRRRNRRTRVSGNKRGERA